MTLAASHAQFLKEELLPNARLIGMARIKADGLENLFGSLFDTEAIRNSNTIKNAFEFTADYVAISLDADDDRRLDVEIAQEILEQPWFQPDFWTSNMRMLRPALIGKCESDIPLRIKFRLGEMQKAFVFGAWMATIALCRSIAEFALTDRAHNLGISATRKMPDNTERYLKLDDLISAVGELHAELENKLRVLQEAGNRVLHPRKKQNVIPNPKIFRAEAYDCVKETIAIVEALYTK